MATLAVLVHYDPHGMVADHVRHTIDTLRPAADRLVFVTTADLQPAARARLDTVDDVIARPNTGYDFYSWRTGLLANPDWPDHDRVILANDSIVGPLAPAASLLDHMAATGAGAYGITISHQYLTHLQSYFMAFAPTLLRNPYFHAFWHAMPAIDDRERVIDEYELGLARLLADLATPLAATFTPTPQERRLAASRNLRISASRRPLAAAAYGLVRSAPAGEHDPARGAFSPVHVLWDRALTGALPAVKVSHFTRPFRTVAQLRRDLQRLGEAAPDAFAGFAAYVGRVGGPRL